MPQLGKESSIYRGLLTFPSFQKWLEIIERHSRKFEKYHSFLPEQLELLAQIHASLVNPTAKVICFTAPPASGKTHVIALCAVYLSELGTQVCVVTPNSELRIEFQMEFKEVYHGSQLPVVISIASYMRRRDEFDYALVDEAHNLRSALELDPNVVRSFLLRKGSNVLRTISDFQGKGYPLVSKELSLEAAHDVLKELLGSKYHYEVRKILSTLSQWRCFCIATRSSCEVRFLVADPERRSILPKGTLFLFSATLLDPDEFELYCNVPKATIQPPIGKIADFVPRRNVAYCYAELPKDSAKTAFVTKLLSDGPFRSLVLVNNDSACKVWGQSLRKNFGSRVLIIGSGLGLGKRAQVYREYNGYPDGILVTSSNVFWEGITIDALRLLVIPNPPFPRPSIFEIVNRRYAQLQKIMRRRLIQGIGRIGRTKTTQGVCLLMFRTANLTKEFENVTLKKAKLLVDSFQI